MSEQPPSAARFLYATAPVGIRQQHHIICNRSIHARHSSAPPLSAFSPIHGTYPKFRRPIEPMPASPTRISPKPRNPSTRVDRARRGNRPRYRRRHPPSPRLHLHRLVHTRKKAGRPFGRPAFRIRSIARSKASARSRHPAAKLLPAETRRRACGGRTIRRRTWPSGAPGDRNARWRPSRCARTARRRAPGTRESGGCSGPRS